METKNLQTVSILNEGQQTNQIKKRSRIYSKNYGNIVNLRKTISRAARYRDDPDGNVINLSKHSFTKKQFKLLNKNLNFCPMPGYYNKKEIKTDIENFERKIKLKSFFELKNQNKSNENNSTSPDIPNITPKSTWEPPKNHHNINTFIEALNNDVDELFKHKQTLPRNNISQHEKNITSAFSKREDLVFSKADKGGATVILEKAYA